MQKELKINDRRKFDAEGNATEVVQDKPKGILEGMNRILSEIPCVYDEPRPIKNYVLVKQNASRTTYAGTQFVIPETARESPNKGVIVAVGPQVESAKAGDVITFGRFNAEPIEIDGELFQLVNEHDIKLVESVTYAVQA